jgi:hypothetical protein
VLAMGGIANTLASAKSAGPINDRLAALAERLIENERQLTPLQAAGREAVAAADKEVVRRLGFGEEVEGDEQYELWHKTRREVRLEMGVEEVVLRCKPGVDRQNAIFDEMAAVPVQSLSDVALMISCAVLACQIPYLWTEENFGRHWAGFRKIVDNIIAAVGASPFAVVNMTEQVSA